MKDGTVRFNPGIENPDLVEPTGTIDPELAMMFVEADDGTPISGGCELFAPLHRHEQRQCALRRLFWALSIDACDTIWEIHVSRSSGTPHRDRLTILTLVDRRNGQRADIDRQ